MDPLPTKSTARPFPTCFSPVFCSHYFIIIKIRSFFSNESDANGKKTTRIVEPEVFSLKNICYNILNTFRKEEMAMHIALVDDIASERQHLHEQIRILLCRYCLEARRAFGDYLFNGGHNS